MDTEEISKLVRELKLSKEARTLVIEITSEEEERGESWVKKRVVGKIFSRRSVNKETLRNNLPRILRARGRVEIDWVGHNLFVVVFSLAADKRIALDEGPWHFFQDLMLLKEIGMMQTPADVVFDEITMWVQCHNVPMACMESGVIRRIEEKIGKVIEVDEGEEGWCTGNVARVRVSRKIEEPLVRCIPITHGQSNTEVLVVLQYEKLPQFCFSYGIIGHIAKECEHKKTKDDGLANENWLRAGRSSGGWMHRNTAHEWWIEGKSSRGSGKRNKGVAVLVVQKDDEKGEDDNMKEGGDDENGEEEWERGDEVDESCFMETMVQEREDREVEKESRLGELQERAVERKEDGSGENGRLEEGEKLELLRNKAIVSPSKKRNKKNGKTWKRWAERVGPCRRRMDKTWKEMGLDYVAGREGRTLTRRIQLPKQR